MLSERQKEVVVRKANEEIDLPFVSYVGRQIFCSSSTGTRWPVHVRGMVACAPELFERARCALPVTVRDHSSHACVLSLVVSLVPSYPFIALCCLFHGYPACMLCIVLAHLARYSALQGATRVSRHRKGGGAAQPRARTGAAPIHAQDQRGNDSAPSGRKEVGQGAESFQIGRAHV